MKKRAFTLIELLICVVIIGILAAIAIPKFSATKRNAQGSQATSRQARYSDRTISTDPLVKRIYDEQNGTWCYVYIDVGVSCVR